MQLMAIKKRLDNGCQADVHPALGLILIDPSVPECDWADLIHHALLEMTGEHSPYVVRARPALKLLPGGAPHDLSCSG